MEKKGEQNTYLFREYTFKRQNTDRASLISIGNDQDERDSKWACRAKAKCVTVLQKKKKFFCCQAGQKGKTSNICDLMSLQC